MSREPARAGKERSLQELHDAVSVDLLRYFERRVDPVEDAADLLADTFLIAWRRIDRLPADAERSRMWMFVTARGVLANWRRSRRRRSHLAETLRAEMQTAAANGTPSSEDLDVRAAVARLPTQQAELVMLVHWDGFTVLEAGRILNLSESTARGRYQRAKIHLRSHLDGTVDQVPQGTIASRSTGPTASQLLHQPMDSTAGGPS